jgi:hypothetical protein
MNQLHPAIDSRSTVTWSLRDKRCERQFLVRKSIRLKVDAIPNVV